MSTWIQSKNASVVYYKKNEAVFLRNNNNNNNNQNQNSILLLIVDDEGKSSANCVIGGRNVAIPGACTNIMKYINYALKEGFEVCCCDFPVFINDDTPGKWQYSIPTGIEPYLMTKNIITLIDIMIEGDKGRFIGKGRDIEAYLINPNQNNRVCWALEPEGVTFWSKDDGGAADGSFREYVGKGISKTPIQGKILFENWISEQLVRIDGQCNWVEDEHSDKFIQNIFLAPFKNHNGNKDSWPTRWGHDACQSKATDEGTMNAKIASWLNIDAYKYSPDLTKALIMLPQIKNGEIVEKWTHEYEVTDKYTLPTSTIRKILNVLKLDFIEIKSSEIDRWALPIIPGTPFLIALQQYFEALKTNSDLDVDNKHYENVNNRDKKNELRGFNSAIFTQDENYYYLRIQCPEFIPKKGERVQIDIKKFKKKFEDNKPNGLPRALKRLEECDVCLNTEDVNVFVWKKYFVRNKKSGGLQFSDKIKPIEVEWFVEERVYALKWSKKEG